MIKFKRFTTKDDSTMYVIRIGPLSYTFYRGMHILAGPRWDIARYSKLYKWYCIAESHWEYKWRWSPLPVYWHRYSRDCDHCSAEWVERHPNGWTAYSSYCNALDGAEGPERFSRITKAEYIAERGNHSFRDHIMEAHEDGHPYSVGE